MKEMVLDLRRGHAWMWRGGKVMGSVTYSNLRRDKIDLVQHEDEMLVWRFGPDVLLHTATSCTVGVASVENVQDDIGRVDDFV
jgi:hypothetical protein